MREIYLVGHEATPLNDHVALNHIVEGMVAFFYVQIKDVLPSVSSQPQSLCDSEDDALVTGRPYDTTFH